MPLRRSIDAKNGRMQRKWGPDDLIACGMLMDRNWALVDNEIGATRVGFVALLKFFELEGGLVRSPRI